MDRSLNDGRTRRRKRKCAQLRDLTSIFERFPGILSKVLRSARFSIYNAFETGTGFRHMLSRPAVPRPPKASRGTSMSRLGPHRPGCVASDQTGR